MEFKDLLSKETNRLGVTENGAVTLKSSTDPLVDFMATAGSLRKKLRTAVALFARAYAVDKQSALRLLFYIRDVRGGQGERDVFRMCVRFLSEKYPEDIQKMDMFNWIADYGRYDDVFFCMKVPDYIEDLKRQLQDDFVSETPSLLAKWMPSENASSKYTKFVARTLMRELGCTPKQYRKMLSKIRKRISLVEQTMSQGEFSDIEYSTLPSQAMFKYKKAFMNKDSARYQAYLNKVNSGEEKINTSTLYPYQLYGRCSEPGSDELWKNLPDYTKEGENGIVVADVSGSMSGQPMSVSVSLALYYSERNKGAFKDTFLTFSSNPTLQKVKGKTLKDKMHSISSSDWGMHTDLQKTFEVVLNTAVKFNVPKEEMPTVVYIISDMEFDSAVEGETNFETIDKMYNHAGYERPHLVFWNVNGRANNIAVDANQGNTSLVSGLSPVLFKQIVTGSTPVGMMTSIVNSDRYAKIEIDK